MNKQDLLDLIISKIYSNASNEISGDILQRVLIEIVEDCFGTGADTIYVTNITYDTATTSIGVALSNGTFKTYKIDIPDPVTIVQTTGQSTTSVMSQKAVTDKINEINTALTQLTQEIIGRYGPYVSLVEAKTQVPKELRELGLTVGIIENNAVKEYWWKTGTDDKDLILKIDKAVEALVDDEDLTINANQQLKFKNKSHAPESYSGLGRVYLRQNIVDNVNVLTQEMISETNTTYHIQYDYSLGGKEIKLPANSVLEFNGGSLDNGTLIGNDTIIVAGAYKIFGDKLNLSYVMDGDKFVWESPLINDVTASDEDIVNVIYKNPSGLKHRKLDGIREEIAQGASYQVDRVFGLQKKIKSSSFIADCVLLDWFGKNGTPSFQRAVDFAFSSSINEVNVGAGNISLDYAVQTRGGICIRGNSKNNSKIEVNGECGFAVSKTGWYVTLKDFTLQGNHGSKYAVVVLESHWSTITDIYIRGYFQEGGVLYGSVVYPKMRDVTFSMAYNPTEVDKEYPFCISAIESEYKVAYYGINTGIFENCSFNGRGSIRLGGGIVTFRHCDFEGGGFAKDEYVIGLQMGNKPSHLTVLMEDCYFECTPLEEHMMVSIFKTYYASYRIHVKNTKAYLQSYNTKNSAAFIDCNNNDGQVIVDSCQVHRADQVVKNPIIFSRGDISIKNTFIQERQSSNKPTIRDVSQNTYMFTNTSEIINNKNYIHSENLANYKYADGFFSLFGFYSKGTTSKILNAGQGNFIDLKGTTIENVLDSSNAQGGLIAVTDGTIVFDAPFRSGMPYIEENGYYPDFVPTTISYTGGVSNILFVPIVRDGKIVSVYLSKRMNVSNAIVLSVKGAGTGAILEVEKDANNNLTGVKIVDGGSGYDDCYFNESDFIYPLFTGAKITNVLISDECEVRNKYITLNRASDTPAKIWVSTSVRITNPLQGGIKTLVVKKTEIALLGITNNGVFLIAHNSTDRKAGSTAQRPTPESGEWGRQFYDRTIKKLIIWEGSKWIDANGQDV